MSNVVTDLLGKSVTVFRYDERRDSVERTEYTGVVRAVAIGQDGVFSMLVEAEARTGNTVRQILRRVILSGAVGIELPTPAETAIMPTASEFNTWEVYLLIVMVTHGGGFMAGNGSHNHDALKALAARGLVVFQCQELDGIRYTLTPAGIETARALRDEAQ